MSRRIPSLLRRGGRAGVGRGGAAVVAAPLIVNTTGYSGWSSVNRIRSNDATELQATTAQTLVVYFRVDALLGVTRIFSKGSASSSGWSVYGIDQELFFRFWGNTLSMDLTTVEADAVGKTFVAVASIDGTSMRMWVGSMSEHLETDLRGTHWGGRLEDLTVSASATTAVSAAIGVREGTAGTQPATNLTIMGCGLGNTKLTDAQAAQLMRDVVSTGVTPPAFPGATNTYNAITGLHLDRTGNVDLEVVGTLTLESDFTPDFTGDVGADIQGIGQSNFVAPVTAANFTASLLDAYPSVRQYFGVSWVDLDDRGDNATASEVVFMRDLDVAGFIDGATDARLTKRASSGTGFAANDWNPGDLLYLAALGNNDDAIAALAEPTDALPLRAVVWIQGEADAQSAPDAAAYQAAEDAMFDAILADYQGANSRTLFVNCMLPSFQTGLSHRAEVNAAKTANAAARSDVVLVNTDNLLDRGDVLHYNEASHESLGAAIAAAILTRADTVAARPAPSLNTTSPLPDATGVSRFSNKEIYYFQDIDAATVDDTTFLFTETAGGTPIAGVRSVSGGTITFNPDANLTALTEYRIQVTADVVGVAPRGPVAPLDFTFTTGA